MYLISNLWSGGTIAIEIHVKSNLKTLVSKI